MTNRERIEKIRQAKELVIEFAEMLADFLEILHERTECGRLSKERAETQLEWQKIVDFEKHVNEKLEELGFEPLSRQN